VDHLVEPRDELPRRGGDEGDAHEDGEEEGVVLEDALHPRPALVVDEEHGDDLGGLDEEYDGVEQVGLEGPRPQEHELGHHVRLFIFEVVRILNGV
jgi:hypothetical protein